MTNYLIISDDAAEHYFFHPYEGICVRKRNRNGGWSERTQIAADGRDGFGVYADRQGGINLICVDSGGSLIYAVRRDNNWKRYRLAAVNGDIEVSDMRLYDVGGRLNLIYSALYGGGHILVHCILGAGAKPSVIGRPETAHFCIFDGRLYFTDTSGRLGYISLHDEKPDGFIPVENDAHCAALYAAGNKNLLIYTRESRLYINNEEILYDSRMEMPVCGSGGGKLYIMWKSGSFVRYITSLDGGTSWSAPMRFVNTDSAAVMYTVQRGDYVGFHYGYDTKKEIILFGAPDFFTPPEVHNACGNESPVLSRRGL